jgi:hypothetical protein
MLSGLNGHGLLGHAISHLPGSRVTIASVPLIGCLGGLCLAEWHCDFNDSRRHVLVGAERELIVCCDMTGRFVRR